MSFSRGVTLATAPTLGFADSSDLGPTAGNGFFRRWPDDLATVQEHGITDVRLTLDWARLQPKPGVVDAAWAEQYEQMLVAADAIGLRVWATMYDGSVPRWFDNEGGMGDDEALTVWWPRFVGRVAERFGDLVGGWIPFATIPAASPDQPWRDTWGILGSGEPSVIAMVAGPDLERRRRLTGLTDQIGVDLAVDVADDEEPTEQRLADTTERWCGEIETAADGTAAPVAVGLTLRIADPDVSGSLVAGLVTAADETIAGGTEVSVCFLDPGIAGPDDPAALFGQDRAPLPGLTAFLAD